ncbi:hypothetical protein [Micromonospora sonneratiae]|uniref:Uncharacterized protein n=1 Tax=Micromonospora sonneratiae TaxID=1184706 RepID=A0ABW3YLQ3_9ACTN
MAPPLARTNEEAHLYLELHPCPCGEADFGATSSVTMVDGNWIVRYSGRCVECDRPRSFEFRQPEELAVPDEGEWAPGQQPSELLDAGEWLWVADTYGSVPVGAEGLSDAQREQVRVDLVAARAAIDEVRKFLPDTAAEVPDDAFWSYRGREVRAAEPGRFGRLRLDAARAAYERSLAELDG